MKTRALTSISTFVIILFFTSSSFSTPLEAVIAKTTIATELTKDQTKKDKRSFKKRLAKVVIKAERYLAKNGIDLKDPTKKWLWYSIFSLVVGGLFTIAGYLFYFIGIGTATNNNGPNSTTIIAVIVAYILLIIASILFLFSNIAFYVWLIKLLTEDSEEEKEES